MAKELIFKLKKSKLLLGTFILCAIIFIIDISAIIFNIVELILVSKNSASLSSSFLAFNISIAVINVALLIVMTVLLILRKSRYYKSSKNSQKR